MSMIVNYRATLKKPEKLRVERMLPKGVQDFMVKKAMKEAYKLAVGNVLVMSLVDIFDFVNMRLNNNDIYFVCQDICDSLDRLRISGEIEFDKEKYYSHEVKYKIYGIR